MNEKYKMDERVKKALNDWIIQHPRVAKNAFVNYFLKWYIGGHYGPHLVTKLVLKISVRQLHNGMVSPPEEGGLREKIYASNNIIIIDFTLRTILPS